MDCVPVIYFKDLNYFCLSVHCKALKAEHFLYISINVNCTVYLPLYEKTRTNANTEEFTFFHYADPDCMGHFRFAVTLFFLKSKTLMLYYLIFVYQNI